MCFIAFNPLRLRASAVRRIAGIISSLLRRGNFREFWRREAIRTLLRTKDIRSNTATPDIQDPRIVYCYDTVVKY